MTDIDVAIVLDEDGELLITAQGYLAFRNQSVIAEFVPAPQYGKLDCVRTVPPEMGKAANEQLWKAAEKQWLEFLSTHAHVFVPPGDHRIVCHNTLDGGEEVKTIPRYEASLYWLAEGPFIEVHVREGTKRSFVASYLPLEDMRETSGRVSDEALAAAQKLWKQLHGFLAAHPKLQPQPEPCADKFWYQKGESPPEQIRKYGNTTRILHEGGGTWKLALVMGKSCATFSVSPSGLMMSSCSKDEGDSNAVLIALQEVAKVKWQEFLESPDSSLLTRTLFTWEEELLNRKAE